jgi:protein-tyrosine phosphatase
MKTMPTDTDSRHSLAQGPRLKGATNFRDVGGYTTSDGRRVRQGRIFRSNQLGQLTIHDLAQLETLGVHSVVDFRSDDEVAKAGPGLLTGAFRHTLPIEPTIGYQLRSRLEGGQPINRQVTEELMCDLYRGFVRDHAGHFRRFFELLLAESTPLVFHCSAGKDRTGFAAALVLSTLGVSREIVFQDYMLTNLLWRVDPSATGNLPADVTTALGRAEEAFLAAAYETIDTEFGGIDHYLSQELGLQQPQRTRLSELYLEQ